MRDSSGHPIADVSISLQTNASAEPVVTHTDSAGAFRFSGLSEGVYTLRADKAGFGKTTSRPWNLGSKEAKSLDLVLAPLGSSTKKNSVNDGNKDRDKGQPEFFDEPAFTVAGVTDTANLGGHGSNTVARSQEALARDTASLGREQATMARPAALLSSAAKEKEKSLRETVQREPQNIAANRELGNMLLAGGNAAEAIPYLEQASRLDRGGSQDAYNLARAYQDTSNYQEARATAQSALASPGQSPQEQAQIHNLLGDVEEKSGNSLDAVREYQRAAELDPNESHLFDWGAELLAHRAAEPAIDVFTQGNRLFPASARMLIGLGVALYVHGANDQAAERLCQASDLNPDDKTPYLFLGKMQSAEVNQSGCMAARFERFVRLQPQDPLANYYLAISLSRQRKISNDPQTFPQELALLEKAVQLDPKLGLAYLQLGIVYSGQQDLPHAISAYQNAIAVSPELEEAHYRLGQAYQRAGNPEKAKQELELYAQLSKKKEDELEHERQEIQQFVFTLRTPAVPHAPE